MQIQLLNDKIAVQQQKVADKELASGLIIPEATQEKPQEGVVIAVGPGMYNEYHNITVPLSVKVGDTVYFSKYGGATVNIDGEDVLIMTERDLLAKKPQGE